MSSSPALRQTAFLFIYKRLIMLWVCSSDDITAALSTSPSMLHTLNQGWKNTRDTCLPSIRFCLSLMRNVKISIMPRFIGSIFLQILYSDLSLEINAGRVIVVVTRDMCCYFHKPVWERLTSTEKTLYKNADPLTSISVFFCLASEVWSWKQVL